MGKEKIEQANDGVFMNFEKLGKGGEQYAYKFDRDKKRNAIIGIRLIKKTLIYVENSEGFYEIANRKKAELLGIVYLLIYYFVSYHLLIQISFIYKFYYSLELLLSESPVL